MYFQFYQARDGLWYWRLKASNEKVIARGVESYATSTNVRQAIRRVQKANLAEAKVTRGNRR